MVAAEEGQSLQRDHRKRRRTGRRALALQRDEVMQRGGGGRTVTEAVRVGGARGCSGDAGRRSGGRWWRLGTARTVGVVEAEWWADGRRPAETALGGGWRGRRRVVASVVGAVMGSTDRPERGGGLGGVRMGLSRRRQRAGSWWRPERSGAARESSQRGGRQRPADEAVGGGDYEIRAVETADGRGGDDGGSGGDQWRGVLVERRRASWGVGGVGGGGLGNERSAGGQRKQGREEGLGFYPWVWKIETKEESGEREREEKRRLRKRIED